MVPVILLPAMLYTAQLAYEGTKAVLDKLGRELCPEFYSEFRYFIQEANS